MKILIIEDDKSLVTFLKDELSSKTHIVDISTDGISGSYTARTNTYDVIILDYSLPQKDGIAVCKEIRDTNKNVPIIFLSANPEESTKVKALDIGADDYMTKPFSMKELLARLNALTRRTGNIKSPILNTYNISIDNDLQKIFIGKKEIKMTNKEFSLFEYLLRNKKRVVSRSEIMEHVWNADSDPFSNTIEAHIRTIRKKINQTKSREIIKNVPGRGYIIEK